MSADTNTQKTTSLKFPSPIPSIFLFLVAALTAGALLIGYLALNPLVAGFARTETLGETVYQFETMEFSRPHLSVEFQGGWLVPLYRSGEVSGVLIIGSGSYLVEPAHGARDQFKKETGHSDLYDSLKAMYVPVDFRDFQNLVYDARAKQQESKYLLERAQTYLEQIRNTTTTVQAYGIRRDWYTNPNVVQLFGESFGRVSYAATDMVSLNFLDIDGLELALGPSHSGIADALSTKLSVAPQFLLVYLSLTLLSVFLVFVLTLDTVPNSHLLIVSRRLTERSNAAGVRYREFLTMVVAAVVIELVANLILQQAGSPDWAVVTWRIAATLAVVGYAFRFELPWAMLGLTSENWVRGILIGGLLGILGFVYGTLAVPRGFIHLNDSDLLQHILWAFVVVGYAGEIFRRGFVQSYFELLLGQRWGLIAATLTFGLLSFVPVMVLGGQPSPADIIQGFAIIPAYNFLLGYMFQRTGSIHASALAAGLMTFLPYIVRV